MGRNPPTTSKTVIGENPHMPGFLHENGPFHIRRVAVEVLRFDVRKFRTKGNKIIYHIVENPGITTTGRKQRENTQFCVSPHQVLNRYQPCTACSAHASDVCPNKEQADIANDFIYKQCPMHIADTGKDGKVIIKQTKGPRNTGMKYTHVR